MSGGSDDGGRSPGGRSSDRPALRRFYARVSVDERDEGCCVLLDGRPVRTPRRRLLAHPDAAIAGQAAAEWAAQGDLVDPRLMPLTRLINSAIDAVGEHMGEVRADIVRYAGSDLLCYRAAHPRELAIRQAAAWDPPLGWLDERHGVRLIVQSGLMPLAQAPEVPAAFDAAIGPADAFRLAALHAMTTLMGSAVLALAVVQRRLDAEAAWVAAHVDEDWQISQWGEDAEAAGRRAYRRAEFMAAVALAG